MPDMHVSTTLRSSVRMAASDHAHRRSGGLGSDRASDPMAGDPDQHGNEARHARARRPGGALVAEVLRAR